MVTDYGLKWKGRKLQWSENENLWVFLLLAFEDSTLIVKGMAYFFKKWYARFYDYETLLFIRNWS